MAPATFLSGTHALMLRFVSGNQLKAQSLVQATLRRALALSSPTLIAECSGTENSGQFVSTEQEAGIIRDCWLKVVP